MTQQLALFADVATVPSPLCSYARKPCWRGGRAVYGAPVIGEGCVNRSVICVTCQATGEESRCIALSSTKERA